MYLFFDTETSGLPKVYKAPISDSDNWPRLVQIAWAATDDKETVIAEETFIIKPKGFFIPESASNVHGITTEMAMDEGVSLREVLEHFASFVSDADIVVAHNINFDKKIIYAEYYRNDMKEAIDTLHAREKICTMFKSTKHCNLPKPSGRGGAKWPKLAELYEVLFDDGFEGAHDALVDIRATMRCFWELVKIGVIEVPEQLRQDTLLKEELPQPVEDKAGNLPPGSKGFGEEKWG